MNLSLRRSLKTIGIISFFSSSLFSQMEYSAFEKTLRPNFHFAPKAHWINDPNGMILIDSVYHLFYQYYPGASVWGPMHWGHATSIDLMHWEELPIALYPDSLGYIFSGSAVLDEHNTSGLGKDGVAPLVAIFTHHDPHTQGRIDFQTQSLAYSLDKGRTWEKYTGNPVIPNPGIIDFRDPKVRWYEATKQWVMTLATKDCVTFYASPDLIHWRKESVFGKLEGAHGGVWECPDLFPLQFNGEEYWILTVNMNPGGPNMGSGIQYFIGKFDGYQFQPLHQDIRWLDYGPDNYAGVTFSNTGSRIIQMGWMSNWDYAEKLPTKTWRNSMTIPRELQLKKIGSELRVCSFPIAELKLQRSNKFINSGSLQSFKNINKTKTIYPSLIQIDISSDEDFHFAISNKKGEETVVGFDVHQQQFYIDRTKSGVIDFHPHFQGRKIAPRFAQTKTIHLSILIDAGSIEVFADQGATVLTALNFPTTPYDQIKIHSKKPLIKGHFEWIQYK